MNKGRVEAFSDGVIAILITIMVLELRPPHDATLASMRPLLPIFLCYLLSFVFLGIYWNNHHHMLQAAHHVDGRVLWANLHLLFWLSLVPFVTVWMGENHFDALPVATYGAVMLASAIAYFILARLLVAINGKDSPLGIAFGADTKGKVSPLIYAVAIPLAFFAPLLSCALYVTVAIIWLVPDRRIEKTLAGRVSPKESTPI